MSIVPEMVVAGRDPDIVVRPLRPPLSRTLALIEHRNKPNEPALDIVRNALLALRAAGQTSTGGKRNPGKGRRLDDPGSKPRRARRGSALN
jgi:hypothetical protein